MIFYLTLFLTIFFFFKPSWFFSSVNIFFIFLFITQDYFGWYPSDYKVIFKYKGDTLMVVAFIYILVNFKDKIFREIVVNLKPLYISYFTMMAVYLFCYFFNIYDENKNLLSSRIFFYFPILITAFTLCLVDCLKSNFFSKNYEKLLLVFSLVILVLNYIILTNPDHTQYFNSYVSITRFDQSRVLQGGVVCIILSLVSKTMLFGKINRSGIKKLYLYLSIISNYIVIGFIGQGRTLFISLTLAIVISSLLTKKIFTSFLFAFTVAFLVINFSEVYYQSIIAMDDQTGNGQFRLDLLAMITDSIKTNFLFGIGIQSKDCMTCLDLPMKDIGIFGDIYFYGFLGITLLITGIIFAFRNIYKSCSPKQTKDLFISISVFFFGTMPVISNLISYDAVLMVGTLFAFLILESENHKNLEGNK